MMLRGGPRANVIVAIGARELVDVQEALDVGLRLEALA